MLNKKINIFKLIPLLFLVGAIMVPLVVIAYGGWQIPANTFGWPITDSSGTCRKIISITYLSYFIPTQTATEWNAFVTNKPAALTIADCCTPTTCGALGYTCGAPADGCGGTLSCGTCSVNYCSGNVWYGSNTCSSGTCSPAATGCCAGSYCAAGNYCRESDHSCQAVPTCQVRVEAGFGTTGAADYTYCGTCKLCVSGSCVNSGYGSNPNGDCFGIDRWGWLLLNWRYSSGGHSACINYCGVIQTTDSFCNGSGSCNNPHTAMCAGTRNYLDGSPCYNIGSGSCGTVLDNTGATCPNGQAGDLIDCSCN